MHHNIEWFVVQDKIPAKTEPIPMPLLLPILSPNLETIYL